MITGTSSLGFVQALLSGTRPLIYITITISIVCNTKDIFYWYLNRAMKFDDYFSFPRVLDMAPYTAEGRAEQESR